MKKILAGVAVLSFSVSTYAQGDGGYVIQGIWNPTLADAQSFDLRPEPIDTVLADIPVRYNLLPAKWETRTVESLLAARLTVSAMQEKLYKGFLKGGFGLYTTPLGELYYDQSRSRQNGYGIHLKHMSSNGGLDDVGPSDYSFNSVDGFYKHFLPDHEASGRLMYVLSPRELLRIHLHGQLGERDRQCTELRRR